MKKFYVLLVALLFATGCKETFRGQLELQKGIAFVKDPDGYWVEVVRRDKT